MSTKTNGWVAALAGWLVIVGCSEDPSEAPDWTPLPPVSSPTAAVLPHTQEDPSRTSTPLRALDACQRRSQARIDDAWARILLDFDPEHGQRRRTRPVRGEPQARRGGDPQAKQARPFAPVVAHTLAPCRRLLDAAASWPPTLVEALGAYVRHGEIAGELIDALARAFAPDASASVDALAQQVVPTLALAMQRFDASADVLRERTTAALTAAEADALAPRDPDAGPTQAFRRQALALVHGGRAVDACLRESETDRQCLALVKKARALVEALEAHCEAHPEPTASVFWATAVRRSARELGRTLAQTQEILAKRELKDAERTTVLAAFDRLAIATDETFDAIH